MPNAGSPRVALVTGGGKGIGLAIGQRLAASGWQLVLCGRDQRALDEAVAQARERHGVEGVGISVDLSRPGAVESLFSRWQRPEQLPAAMVCGAADYGVLGPLHAVDFAAWKRSFDLNFFSVAEMIHHYVRIAVLGGSPPRRRIVVIGGAGLGSARVSGAVSGYSCAKAALHRLVEVVHEEVHARGIDINCVLPGLVNTGMVDQAIAAGPILGPLYEASLEARAGGGTPPESVADFIDRLLADDAAGISGRLLSARWDGPALTSPAAVASDPDLFRLRRIDNDLYGKRR